MPVGRRRSVCTSHSCRSFLLTVSPAPPSNRTLSGTTTAARPFCFKRVFTCWIKLSCLLDVVAQKSWRSMISVSRDTLPFSATMVVLLFLPKGGLVSTAWLGQLHNIFSKNPFFQQPFPLFTRYKLIVVQPYREIWPQRQSCTQYPLKHSRFDLMHFL